MDDDSLNSLKWGQVEEMVLQILKTSQLETSTEFAVRSAAADRLGFDLSVFPYRQLVHQLVDSFLLSAAVSILDNNEVNEVNCKRKLGKDDLEHSYTGKVICKLSDNRRVIIYDSTGTNMVAIRDFYTKDGNLYPKLGPNVGLSFTAAEWSSLKNSFPSIEKACVEMESRVRSETSAKQNATNNTNLLSDCATMNPQIEASNSGSRRIIYPPIKKKRVETDTSGPTSEEHIQEPNTSGIIAKSNPKGEIPTKEKQRDNDTSRLPPTSDSHEEIPSDRKQTEPDFSNSTPALANPTPPHHKVNSIPLERLLPIITPRLDGKNYPSWRHHMEKFLRQLNLAYVLTHPSPELARHDENSGEDAMDRWVNDDYMCRQHILKSLCDSLFQWHSQNISSARELWEGLKLAYNEDFRTKGSLINKYIHFEMVDGVSVVEQVQGLHKMADSIMASGTRVEEDFHVGVIVSKLPPSWKEFRCRLMREEGLSVNTLMLRLQVEEESRRWRKKESSYENNNNNHGMDQKFDQRSVMKKKVCYNCHKEGHYANKCRERRKEKENGVSMARNAESNVGQMANRS